MDEILNLIESVSEDFPSYSDSKPDAYMIHIFCLSYRCALTLSLHILSSKLLYLTLRCNSWSDTASGMLSKYMTPDIGSL